MIIEPLRLIGWFMFVSSFFIIKKAYDSVLSQEESEAPDLSTWFRSKIVGQGGVFFFLTGLVLIINGGSIH